MRIRVKVCGITRVEDALAAVAAGADALGFVLWPQSPRGVSIAVARDIGRALPPFVARVGVFVDAPPAEVAAASRDAGLDVIQLHGDEIAADYLSCGLRVIKSVSLGSDADLAAALALPAEVTPLVDARDPVRRGGTGTRANWPLARALASARRTVLAGGLDAASVRQAIRDVGPWGLDVSSGVEDAPGRKSAVKLTAFFAAVQGQAGDHT